MVSPNLSRYSFGIRWLPNFHLNWVLKKAPASPIPVAKNPYFGGAKLDLRGSFFMTQSMGCQRWPAGPYIYISKKKAARPPSKNQGHPEIDDLLNERRAPRAIQNAPEMTVRYMDKSGKMRCKGGADLKQSQHYPMRRLAWICSTCLRSFSLVQIG